MARNLFSNSYLLGLPNCIGLSERGKCMWLNINECKGEQCKFKRLVAEHKLKQTNAFEQLASLSDSQQTYIANKYYRGKKPWVE